MAKRYVYAEVKLAFELRGFVLLDTVYLGTQVPMDCICVCGTRTRLCLNNLNNGRKCRSCGSQRAADKLRGYTFNAVSDLYAGYGLEVLRYTTTLAPLDYVCSCGRLASITATTRLIEQPIKCEFCRSLRASSDSRHILAYKILKQEVELRDGTKCTNCDFELDLCLHHVLNWDDYPELRFSSDNCTTLCNTCHRVVHNLEIASHFTKVGE